MFKQIVQEIYSIDHIPSFPIIHDIIIEQSRYFDSSDKYSLQILATTISYEPTLTLEFLKIANSDSFGYKGKISNIREALLILEDELIKLIISQHPVIPELTVYGKEQKRFFKQILKHSIEVNVVLQNLIKQIPPESPVREIAKNDLIASATLHDIGLLFLIVYFPKELLKELNLLKLKGYAKKRTTLHSLPGHSFIGSLLCSYWNLPPVINTSIAFHHRPWTGIDSPSNIADLLYLADTLSDSFYEIFYDEDDVYSMDERIMMQRDIVEIIEKYKLDIENISLMKEITREKCQSIYTFLGI